MVLLLYEAGPASANRHRFAVGYWDAERKTWRPSTVRTFPITHWTEIPPTPDGVTTQRPKYAY